MEKRKKTNERKHRALVQAFFCANLFSMRLYELLKAHDSYDSIDNLGDGCLLKNNSIYGKIRRAAIRAGFEISNQVTPEYLALPLTQLEEVLASKKLPYINNVSVLRKIKINLDWQEISEGFKKNYLFHESCHGAARSFWELSKNPQEKLLQVLLEESFANTCELLSVLDCEKPEHRIFLEVNSYTALFSERTHLKRAVEKFGFQEFFKFMLLAYLHSNFLRHQLSEKEFSFCIENSGIASHDLKTLKALSKIAFTLDLQFRTVTSGVHLELMGLPHHAQDLQNFKIESSKLLSALDGFCDILNHP